jgi:hypothetical protein
MAYTRFLMAALVAVVLMAESALAADNGGPCKGGFWPDAGGCCPQIISGNGYYRDTNNQCYPRNIGGHVFYADSDKCVQAAVLSAQL